MAERTRAEAQRKRADAREGRRGSTSQTFEALDEAAGGDGSIGGDPVAAAKQAARTAAAAAIAGGLAGALKALIERRGRGPAAEGERGTEESEPGSVKRRETSGKEMATGGVADDAREEADDDVIGTAEPHADDAPRAVADEDRQGSDGGEEEGQRGASSSEVTAVADRARMHVLNLLGKEPEMVSGISRRNGSWALTVEVVDVHRIPDSTDILSSYEVVVDNDGDLLRLEHRGRYRRAQVEEER
jgi:hypothetical protein